MTDIKISQLSNVSSSQLTDLFEISRSLAPGWESKSITYHDLLHSIQGQEVITVGGAGAIASTIEAGIQHAISVGPPSATNPMVIVVHPGIYTENPLTIPAYLSLVSLADGSSTYIDAVTTTSPIITASSNSYIYGFYLRGANGAGGAAIKITGSNGVIISCSSENCESGFWITGTSAYARAMDCAVINYPGKTCTYGFRSDGGALFTVEQSIANGVTAASLISYGFYSEGSNSRLYVPTFFSYYCTNGLYADNGGSIRSSAGIIRNCTNGIRIATNGISEITSLGTAIESSTSQDVLIESVSSHVDFSGSMNYNKRSIVSGAEFYSIGFDSTNEIARVTGNFNAEGTTDIGIPGQKTLGLGIGLDVGEGGSYNFDHYGSEIVEYWQYDASVASGSRFTRYANNAGTQLTSVDDAIVVGSKFPFSAVRLNVNVAANVGSNDIVTEHWNGLSWTADTVCAYEKTNLTHRDNTIFQNVETQYVEVGTPINDDWSEDDNVLDEIPNWDLSTDMYPIRFRNNSGALTTGMQFTLGKVRGDDFDVTESGLTVNWGRNRSIDTQIIHILGMAPDAVNPTSNATIQISSNITQSIPSEYTDSRLCSMGFSYKLPSWVDTSTPVVVTISAYASNNNLGNFDFRLRWVEITTDTIFDGSSSEGMVSIITPTVGIVKHIMRVTKSVDISSYAPGDDFVLAIERDATGANPLDTYVGDIILTELTFGMTRKIIG